MCISICLPVCNGSISVFLLQRRVKDVISPIVFEASYSLGEHVIERGKEDKELPSLKPVLRWKKGQKIAQRNQVRFWLFYFPRLAALWSWTSNGSRCKKWLQSLELFVHSIILIVIDISASLRGSKELCWQGWAAKDKVTCLFQSTEQNWTEKDWMRERKKSPAPSSSSLSEGGSRERLHLAFLSG